MSWWQYAILGALGGALVESLALFRWINVWKNARRTAIGTLKSSPPTWRRYVDVQAHVWLLLIRTPLGAGAAVLFGITGQISGSYAAVAFGFAAPAVLAQLGSIPQVADPIKGGTRKNTLAGDPQGNRSDRHEVQPLESGGAT
jgi:hypothetical protein